MKYIIVQVGNFCDDTTYSKLYIHPSKYQLGLRDAVSVLSTIEYCLGLDKDYNYVTSWDYVTPLDISKV